MKFSLLKLKVICFTFLLLYLHTTAWSWDHFHHRVVAQIAYDNLTPKAKKLATALLHATDRQYPYRTFVTAATWADDIKEYDQHMNAWHYIDIPYSIVNSYKLKPPHKRNVVWAIERSVKILQNPRARNFDKAIALRLLIHWVGDIHQPLHCISFYGTQFPRSDRGGNDYWVKMNDKPMRLHALWDQALLGEYQALNPSIIKQTAHELEAKYPLYTFQTQLAITDASEWADESHHLARRYVYAIQPEQIVDATYLATNREIAARQLGLAGYRLAYLLNRLLV